MSSPRGRAWDPGAPQPSSSSPRLPKVIPRMVFPSQRHLFRPEPRADSLSTHSHLPATSGFPGRQCPSALNLWLLPAPGLTAAGPWASSPAAARDPLRWRKVPSAQPLLWLPSRAGRKAEAPRLMGSSYPCHMMPSPPPLLCFSHSLAYSWIWTAVCLPQDLCSG